MKLLFMIISHVKIIAFQLSLFCKNYRFSKTVFYIINRKIHGWLEIPNLFLVLNMTSHLFAALTCEISCSTLEIRAGKCPAAPAAPLPGNVSQNIFAGNFLTPCRKFLSSYILECHIIYLFSLKISKAFCKLILSSS